MIIVIILNSGFHDESIPSKSSAWECGTDRLLELLPQGQHPETLPLPCANRTICNKPLPSQLHSLGHEKWPLMAPSQGEIWNLKKSQSFLSISQIHIRGSTDFPYRPLILYLGNEEEEKKKKERKPTTTSHTTEKVVDCPVAMPSVRRYHTQIGFFFGRVGEFIFLGWRLCRQARGLVSSSPLEVAQPGHAKSHGCLRAVLRGFA